MGFFDKLKRLGGKKQESMADQDPRTELQNMRGYPELKRYQQERKNSENSIDPDA